MRKSRHERAQCIDISAFFPLKSSLFCGKRRHLVNVKQLIFVPRTRSRHPIAGGSYGRDQIRFRRKLQVPMAG